MKRYFCDNCGNEVHFDSTSCLGCDRLVGIDPASFTLLSADDWSSFQAKGFRPCANRELINCNWLVPLDDSFASCRACRHNDMIPDLKIAGNQQKWTMMEDAKRGLFYSLIQWNLPLPTLHDVSDGALIFDFKADELNADGSRKPVLTGHDNGRITINIAEADDAQRESRRQSMGEPYRTLLGHFRHEIGHYYWDLLVRDGGQIDACRALFGDETEDYGEALERHYKEGAPQDWQDRYISTYATSHPWEDFAETWAHYIHMVDALQTARVYGLNLEKRVGDVEKTEIDFRPYQFTNLNDLIEAWVPLTISINSINRSLGQPDLYPFVLSDSVEAKLAFVHDLIHNAAAQSQYQ